MVVQHFLWLDKAISIKITLLILSMTLPNVTRVAIFWRPARLRSHYKRIGALCLRQLRSAAPHHPAAAGWTDCKPEPFGQTLWSEPDVLTVLDAINTVLYDQLDLLADHDELPRTAYAALARQVRT